MPAASELDIDGRKVRVTNLHKVLYPESGFTKAQVIDYYARIADVLLPHLQKRPVTLKRYPDGVSAEFFYEKNAPAHRPSWLKTARFTWDLCPESSATSAEVAAFQSHALPPRTP